MLESTGVTKSHPTGLSKKEWKFVELTNGRCKSTVALGSDTPPSVQAPYQGGVCPGPTWRLLHVTTCPVQQERGALLHTPPVICSLSPRARWGGWISVQTWSLLQASPLRVTSRCSAVSHSGTGDPQHTRRNPPCDLCGSRPWNSPPDLACETLQNHQAGRLVFPLLLKNRQLRSPIGEVFRKRHGVGHTG